MGVVYAATVESEPVGSQLELLHLYLFFKQELLVLVFITFYINSLKPILKS